MRQWQQRVRVSRRRAIGAGVAAGASLLLRAGARAIQSDVDAIVAAMPLRERAARMFMLPVLGTALSAADDSRLRALK